MSQDSYNFDGTVTITEYIKHYRTMPQKIYEITQALDYLSDEQQIKVMKYITRITDKRVTFRELQKPMTKKQFFRALKKIDERNKA